jgi:hypothetical protein
MIRYIFGMATTRLLPGMARAVALHPRLQVINLQMSC